MQTDTQMSNFESVNFITVRVHVWNYNAGNGIIVYIPREFDGAIPKHYDTRTLQKNHGSLINVEVLTILLFE